MSISGAEELMNHAKTTFTLTNTPDLELETDGVLWTMTIVFPCEKNIVLPAKKTRFLAGKR
jgi:hypothetical protein